MKIDNQIIQDTIYTTLLATTKKQYKPAIQIEAYFSLMNEFSGQKKKHLTSLTI